MEDREIWGQPDRRRLPVAATCIRLRSRQDIERVTVSTFRGLARHILLTRCRCIAYQKRCMSHLWRQRSCTSREPRATELRTCLPLPPLDEQRAIAAYLDRETERIDALVAKKRLLIERLEEYRTALITRTVTRGLPPEAARAAGLDPSPRLKPSGVEWLGEVPEHWERLRARSAAAYEGRSPIGSQLHADDSLRRDTANPANIAQGRLVPDDRGRLRPRRRASWSVMP